MNRVDEELKMNKTIIKRYCISMALLVSAVPTISYAYNNVNVNQSMIMPPPGPYRSVNNNQPKPKIPAWVQQQKNGKPDIFQGQSVVHI